MLHVPNGLQFPASQQTPCGLIEETEESLVRELPLADFDEPLVRLLFCEPPLLPPSPPVTPPDTCDDMPERVDDDRKEESDLLLVLLALDTEREDDAPLRLEFAKEDADAGHWRPHDSTHDRC